MRDRSCVAICLLALLLCGSCVAFAQTYHLDIALEGPWILYEEQHLKDKNQQDVAVLIAIAPSGATAASVGHRDKIHHHTPQMSTGDGYYIPAPGVYCLKFDDECGPAGATSLISGPGYPQGQLLKMAYHDPANATTSWPWQTKGSGQIVLILPMPDFYSNDGVWPMRFRTKHNSINDPYTEGLNSIGVLLHYSKGPNSVRLFICDPNQPAVANCSTPATDPKGNKVVVTNTGTLRLQMRAPDTTDTCDHHVRFSYHEMFKIVGNPYNKEYSYIEPAQGMKPDGVTGTFETSTSHKCFDHDDQNASNDSDAGAAQNGTSQSRTMPRSLINTGSLDTAFEDLSKLAVKYKDLTPAKNALRDASKAANQLGDFPRISEVQQIGSLLNDSISAVESFTAKERGHVTKSDQRKLERIKSQEEEIAAATKNGGDCRAAAVLME